jgi:hypothetical protein
MNFSFTTSRFHLKWVPQVWILRAPELWDCKNFFHESQIFVMPTFHLRGVLMNEIFTENIVGDK